MVVGGHGLEHAGLHPLAPAGPVAHIQRSRDAANQGGGRGVAHALHDDVVGAFPGVLPGEHHHPAALGGDHGVVTLVVGVWPLGSEAGQRGVHQLGMTGPEAVVVYPQPFGYAGPETLDDDVGKSRQPPRLVLSVRCLQVHDDAFLAAIPLDGSRRIPEYFSARRLHLDHFCAEVGHHHGGYAASPAAAEVEDGDAIEDLCHDAPFGATLVYCPTAPPPGSTARWNARSGLGVIGEPVGRRLFLRRPESILHPHSGP